RRLTERTGGNRAPALVYYQHVGLCSSDSKAPVPIAHTSPWGDNCYTMLHKTRKRPFVAGAAESPHYLAVFTPSSFPARESPVNSTPGWDRASAPPWLRPPRARRSSW